MMYFLYTLVPLLSVILLQQTGNLNLNVMLIFFVFGLACYAIGCDETYKKINNKLKNKKGEEINPSYTYKKLMDIIYCVCFRSKDPKDWITYVDWKETHNNLRKEGFLKIEAKNE